MKAMGKSAGAFFLLVTMIAADASFGSMRKLELRDLTVQATHVITGTVLSVVSGWTNEGAIETKVRIHVENYLMGSFGDGSVDLTIPGGEVGGIGLAVSDMPHFVKGTRVLLFLAIQDVHSPTVVGLHQGKFTLQKGKVVETGFGETEFLRLVQAEIRAKQEAK